MTTVRPEVFRQVSFMVTPVATFHFLILFLFFFSKPLSVSVGFAFESSLTLRHSVNAE